MSNRIMIMPYNAQWPDQFEVEKRLLATTLGNNCVAIHHVGSTAVPGLAAKNRLDIIIESFNPEATIQPLKHAGFEYMGEFNIPLHYGFRRRTNTEVNLHVYEPRHPEILLNILFRDYLRTHPEEREAYQKHKEALLTSNDSYQKGACNLSNYSSRKGTFIRSILTKAGFQEPRITICSEDHEQKYIDQLINQPIDDDSDINIYCMLYQGTEIVGYASINKNTYSVEKVHLEPTHQNKEKIFMTMLQKWALIKNKTDTKI